MSFIVHLVITALLLLGISRLDIGITIDGFGTALIAALVFGIVNAIVRPIVAFFSLPLTFLTLGLFSLVINGLMFGLAAWIVDDFAVSGFGSAFFGALLLSIGQIIAYAILPGERPSHGSRALA